MLSHLRSCFGSHGLQIFVFWGFVPLSHGKPCFGKELQSVPANPGTHATMPSFPAASSVERRVSKLPAWKRFTGFSLGAHRCSQAQPLGSKDSKQLIPVGNFRGIFPGCSHQHAVCTNISVFMCVSFSLAWSSWCESESKTFSHPLLNRIPQRMWKIAKPKWLPAWDHAFHRHSWLLRSVVFGIQSLHRRWRISHHAWLNFSPKVPGATPRNQITAKEDHIMFDIFRTFFSFSKLTKFYKLQHFFVATSFAGAMQKRRKCCKYHYPLGQRCTKHCQYQCFWKQSKKKTCKLQHFWRVDRKKCWYLQSFCNFKKTWKARNIVNSSILATFGRRNAGIYAFCLPVTAPNPCKLQHLLHLLNRFFVLMNAKNAGIYAFFKKSKIVTWTKPL